MTIALSLTIGKAADAAGIGIDTVRFYERAGLLRKPHRTASGYRLYGPSDVERLRFIRRAKDLGFSLDEVAQLLRLNDARGSRASVRALAQRRLAETERRISQLSAIRRTLRQLLAECHGDGDLAGCPIVEAVLASDRNTTVRPSSRRIA